MKLRTQCVEPLTLTVRPLVAYSAKTSERAEQPLENSRASTSIFVLQATKSQRWMPWRVMPKKDVGGCEKLRVGAYQPLIRRYLNG